MREVSAVGDRVLDLTGYVCPIPLLKADKELAPLQPGQSLLLLTESAQVAKNLLDWGKKRGHRISVRRKEGGRWEIVLTKRI